MACCDRQFPDPDPMFRFIHEEDGPTDFWAMPRNERSRRLRAFLIAKASGEHELMGWMVAMDFQPDTIASLHYLIDVENLSDRRIEAMLKDYSRRVRAEAIADLVVEGRA